LQIEGEAVDLAILLIEDNLTMESNHALRAAQLIKPATVISIHHNTFQIIQQDLYAWDERVNTPNGCIGPRGGFRILISSTDWAGSSDDQFVRLHHYCALQR